MLLPLMILRKWLIFGYTRNISRIHRIQAICVPQNQGFATQPGHRRWWPCSKCLVKPYTYYHGLPGDFKKTEGDSLKSERV